MKKLQSIFKKEYISYFLIFLILFYTIGCKYFKVKDVTPEEFVTIDDIGKIHKSFYVHDRGRIYSLTEIQVDSMNISGYLTFDNKLPPPNK